MAKLVKLQISGIRSFGPHEDQAQQLKFVSPLTLILGQNGCGKTTIIEAIKYACTGDLPDGCNNGQGFVNDPKMSQNSCTKGQIKLKFIDPRGNEITVARVVEVTQTAVNLKFASKSATIRTVTSAGIDRSLSGRCIDITKECCQIINVSPAVLNNVIFCHQENAAWPLDVGQKVKERFDEIFDAQRYNKCTDVLRENLKSKEQAIKLHKSELLYRREKKEQVEKEKRTLQDKEDKLMAFEDDIRVKTEELEPLKLRINEILDLERDLGNLEKQLTIKETTKNGIIEEQNTIKKGLASEFSGTDQELKEKIQSFEDDKRRDENFIVKLEQKRFDNESRSKVVAQEMQEAQSQFGKLNQEKNQYEKRCTERNSLIRQAKDKMNVQNVLLNEDNEGAKSALPKLKSIAETADKTLNDLIADKEMEEVALQMNIDEAREVLARTKQTLTSKEEELRECEQKIEEISSEFLSLSSTDERLNSCTERIKSIEKTIANLNNSFRETEETQKAEGYRSNILKMESELETLESEHRNLQRNDVLEAKIEREKHLIMEKQIEINKIKSKHSNSLKELFGAAVPESNFKNSVLAMQKKADILVSNLTEKIAKKQKEVTTLEVRRQTQQEKIATTVKELKTKQNKISEACNGADFNKTLEKTFEKKESLQLDKGHFSSVRIIYGNFVKKFEEESPCCPVCETKFSQKEALVKKIIASLKTKLNSVPQELTRVESALQEEEAMYNNLQQLKTVNDEIEIVAKHRLPELRTALSEIDQTLNGEKEELQELRNKIVEPQKILDISRNIISDLSSLDQHQFDVERSSKAVEQLQQGLIKVASNKSKQEVEAEIETLKAEISELRRKVDSQMKKISGHKDRMQELSSKRMSLLDEQMRLKEGIQARPALEIQKAELTEKVSVLKEEIADLRVSLIAMDADLKTASDNKDKVMRQSKARIQEERLKVDSFKKLIQELQKIQTEIDEYLTNQVEAQLASIESKIKECKDNEMSLEETRKKLTDMISSKKEYVAKHEYEYKSLQNNVILREKQAAEVDLEIEIQELRRKIGGYNYRSVYQEKQRLILQRENVEKQINSLTGEKTALTESIEEIRQELARPENKKAYTNYMSKLYELKIAEHVVIDLIKYIAALEKAVLDFHKAKMIEINKNIRELWRDIYKGNDVDYIEIKTEHAASRTTKRSYNYKVVQVKKGVELDMRGRCSAGQRVLACLIIRMALAETLSSNCGILALDEPTTNLDRENIQSLCETLARIVTAREHEKNFQLVIITHDEVFLNTLTRTRGVGHYYRVERNDEGFSVISKQYN